MVRTILAPSLLLTPYNLTPPVVTWVAADTGNGNRFLSTGKEILLAKNTDSGSHTFTVTSKANTKGRTGDMSAIAVAAGVERATQIFPQDGWKQTDGYIYVDASDATMYFAVLRIP